MPTRGASTILKEAGHQCMHGGCRLRDGVLHSSPSEIKVILPLHNPHVLLSSPLLLHPMTLVEVFLLLRIVKERGLKYCLKWILF